MLKSNTLFFLCVLLLGRCVAAADRPNVVWLISEDNSIHYQNMFFEHGTATPRIAELAAHGLQFKHAFSCAPVCSVARTTLITGCYAPRIGTQFHRRSVSVPMPEGLEMFPATMRRAGYYTTNNNKKDYNANETADTWSVSSKHANWRSREPGQPFFHVQSFGSTHESSLHFNQRSYERDKTSTDPATVVVAPYHPDTPLFRYTVAKYHDNIRRMDGQIGEVVDMLAADGLLEDTFVFYFGDHGGVLPRGKGYAYESGLHVPLVVRVPENWKQLSDWKVGSHIDGFVEFVDFAPTTLHLAGIPIPPQMDGEPFMGQGISASEVDLRDTAFGYADRFDEKYDMVRTLRKGRYEYVRSYQPFNFDGLQNNYRYNMLAYQEWRRLFDAGELNDTQSQFFRTRPSEMLFDLDVDPHETNNLAADPAYASELEALRTEMRNQLTSMPDLSFYPESFLADQAFDNPVEFGKSHRDQIRQLLGIADLPLQPLVEAESALKSALESGDPMHRYWACIACSTLGDAARKFAPQARILASSDPNLLVRVRAAEFLALIGTDDPRPTIMECLKESRSGIEVNLILNTAALLQDGPTKYEFDISANALRPSTAKHPEVSRRLEYLAPAK